MTTEAEVLIAVKRLTDAAKKYAAAVESAPDFAASAPHIVQRELLHAALLFSEVMEERCDILRQGGQVVGLRTQALIDEKKIT